MLRHDDMSRYFNFSSNDSVNVTLNQIVSFHFLSIGRPSDGNPMHWQSVGTYILLGLPVMIGSVHEILVYMER
ncbi:hypothetical protein GQ457_06G019940 [Hibiscus cannabinus]